jgi:hypothetical protein
MLEDVMGSQQAAGGPIGPRVISLAVKLGQGLGLVSSLYKKRQVCHLEKSNELWRNNSSLPQSLKLLAKHKA